MISGLMRIADYTQRVKAGLVLMVSQIRLGDTVVDVVRKDIKNVHLSVHPPAGSVSFGFTNLSVRLS